METENLVKPMSTFVDEFQTNQEKVYSFVCFIEKLSLKKKMVFLLLRSSTFKLQAISKNEEILSLFSNSEKGEENTKIEVEDYVLVKGTIKVSSFEIKSASQMLRYLELEIDEITLIAKNNIEPNNRPFMIPYAETLILSEIQNSDKDISAKPKNFTTDFKSKDGKELVNVSRSNRMNNRVYDLRTSANIAIFKIRSALINGLRRNLLNAESISGKKVVEATEVQTPKIIGSASESGSEVFELNYFGKKAFLAQSPQLYKQMLIISGFEAVFELGQVFRAEKSSTLRHLSEITMADYESIIHPRKTSIEKGDLSHLSLTEEKLDLGYLQIIEKAWYAIRESVQMIYSDERLSSLVTFLNCEKVSITENPVILRFSEVITILEERLKYKRIRDREEDLTPEEEREIGLFAKQKYGSDLVVISEYPLKIRAFYTKSLGIKDRIEYSTGFDFLLKGQEIVSGAEREKDLNKLKKNLLAKGAKIDSALEYYFNCFKMSVPRHGGFGLGIDRFVSNLLGFRNVRDVVLFSRDMHRIEP